MLKQTKEKLAVLANTKYAGPSRVRAVLIRLYDLTAGDSIAEAIWNDCKTDWQLLRMCGLLREAGAAVFEHGIFTFEDGTTLDFSDYRWQQAAC